MNHYLVSRDGEAWSYGFTAEQLVSFLTSAPHDVTYTIKTIEEAGKSITNRRWEDYDPIASWDEHR